MVEVLDVVQEEVVIGVDGFYRDSSGKRWLVRGDEARPAAETVDENGRLVVGLAWGRAAAESAFGPMQPEWKS